MIYTSDDKRTLDNILKAFAGYIREQDTFDVVYSDKIGYVSLQVHYPSAGVPEVMNTPETLLDALFTEIINDVVFSPDNPQQNHDDPALTGYEKTESRRRITAILETMEDEARYLDFLDTYIEEYPRNSARLGERDGE